MVSNSTTPPFVNYQSPTIIPSIFFTFLFCAITALHTYRTFTVRRKACLYLFLFSFVRFTAYLLRIAWSEHPGSIPLAAISSALMAGSFFLVCEALYTLYDDWITQIRGDATTESPLNNNLSLFGSNLLPLERYEEKILQIIKYILPVCSLFGAVGAIKEFTSTSGFVVGRVFCKISAIGFTLLLGLLVVMVSFFSVKYLKMISGTGKGRLVTILYVNTSFLLLEMVYKMMSAFSSPKDSINREKWVFYAFEAAPELILLVWLGCVDIGRQFYAGGATSDESKRAESWLPKFCPWI